MACRWCSGSVAGLYEMHKYAKLPMEKLIQPAIDLAEKDLLLPVPKPTC